MPKLLDLNNFCEDLKEITSSKIMDKKKFHSEGLFSEQIFGPLKNYTCSCGKYYGVSRSNTTCKICGVDIVNSNERRSRFAKIILPIPVVNPIFYDLLSSIGGNILKSAIDSLMKDEKSVLYIDGDDPVIVYNTEDVPNNQPYWEKLEAIYKMISYLSSNFTQEGIKNWKIINENINNLFINQIIVLPPDLRPAAKGISRNNQVLDKINRYYTQILMKKDIMRGTVINIQHDKSLFYTYFKQLQKDVNELYNHILGKLSKKEGLIRNNILGKRIDFSGRAVISPDPTLKLDECSIPYIMFLEMYKLSIAKKLLEINKFKIMNKAIDFVDKCIEFKSYSLFDLCTELSKGEVCVLNRQPSLHKLGMLGFNVKINKDSVIKVHPLVCQPFNADFDGDQMAVYIPISEESKQEIKDKIFITKNLNSPADESLTTVPSQDIILGIYNLTCGRLLNLNNKFYFKKEEITEGLKIFNECLPVSYPLVKKIVNKKILIDILNDIKFKYDEKELVEVLDNIKKVGFKYSTLFGSTISLENCIIDNSEEIRDKLYESEHIRDQLNNVLSEEVENILKEKFFYSHMINSGARGSWDQVRQLVLTRGFISNFEGEILKVPIKHSLIEGLTQKEFFNSTYGCRKGLLDVALNTGISGYLSRKLIFTCVNLEIDKDLDDCGTSDFLEIYVDTKHKANMLLNKYYLDNKEIKKITPVIIKELVGKTILIRSPIFCKNEKICHKCYGDSYKNLNTRFVGIVAAQCLGERGTQLTLRSFHDSGSAKFKEDDVINSNDFDKIKQMDIIADLSSVSKILHQFKGKSYKDIVSELFEIYSNTGDVYHVHFECVVAQLMWKGYSKWRLLENRAEITPEYCSVQSVPSRESWILGFSFANPKKHIINGILYSGKYKGVMDKLLLGEKI